MERAATRAKRTRRRVATQEHKEVAKAVLRANGQCEGCKRGLLSDGRGWQVHHNPPKRMGGTTKVYKAEDFQVLCIECHEKAHKRRR